MQPPNEAHHYHKRWSVRRTAITFVLAALFFGAGVVVGRGNVHLPLLSTGNPNADLASQLDYSSVDRVYSLLKSSFDGKLDEGTLLNGLKEGLVDAAADPYTEYFTPSEAQEFNQALAGSITGIGAELGTDQDDNIVIVAPLSGYPAEEAGLLPKDIIAAVDGQTTNGMSVGTAVKKIRGKEGTNVTLDIVRGSGSPFKVTITRAKITVPSVKYEITGSIGYIKISQFTEDTVGLATAAAEQFKAKGVKGVVVDVRGNPGGFLKGSVQIASLWLDSGKTVVQQRRGAQVTDIEYASGKSTLKGLPTVVLINEGSASASEILAGALRDNNAATVVGKKSFGKGSVQHLERLSDGSELKVTIARWYTPKGANIDKHGITPDVEVNRSEADVKAGRDPQKDQAIGIVQKRI
ncbi:MAG: S41 family peptidase [Candidatus Saccharimonadales bacterium]